MAKLPMYSIFGVNTYTNPLSAKDGQLIHAVNVESTPYGGKAKRVGNATYLGTPDNSQVNSLFSWTRNDGTTLFTYRASGTKLYYSTQGTGDWTVCGNGTITSGAHIGYDVLGDTMLIVDGAGSTRHSTNGTSFTNTTLAPIGVDVCEYQGRIYVAGTASDLFYSVVNDATNWNVSGTSDSSSITIPGAGKLSKLFKTSDRLFAAKNSGIMNKWDGFQRSDMSTDLGPSSPYAFGKAEDFCFYINQLGEYGFGGDRPQLLSNNVERQFYSQSGSAMAGTMFPVAAGGAHRYAFLFTQGTVTDDFVGQTIPDSILRYDFQKNEYTNWRFPTAPTAYHSYKDTNGKQTLIWGDATGQCYKLTDGVYSDNGAPIPVDMIFFHHGGMPDIEKEWKTIDLFFNPGCGAVVQYAVSDTFEPQSLRWENLGNALSGTVRYRFKIGTRGHVLFIRVTDNSSDSRMTFYGYGVDFDPVDN